MSYERIIHVEFNHCDPAGIVFYPRYFEMTNSVVENFFAETIELPFARIMAQGCGVPTVRVETDFLKPSRLGDRLAFTLEVQALGRTSVTLAIAARSGDELRLTATLKLVWLGQEGRASLWPDDVARSLETHLGGPDRHDGSA